MLTSTCWLRVAWPLGPGLGVGRAGDICTTTRAAGVVLQVPWLPGIWLSMTKSVRLTHAGDQSGAGVSKEGRLAQGS